MSACIYCGAEVGQGFENCPNCGMPVFQDNSSRPANGRKGKILAVAAIAVIVLAIVGVFLGLKLSAKSYLSAAAIKTANALSDNISLSSGNELISSDLKNALRKGKFASSLTVHIDGLSASVNVNCSIPRRKISGKAEIVSDEINMDTDVNFYVDKKHLEFSFPNASNKVYGLTLDNKSNGSVPDSLFSGNTLWNTISNGDGSLSTLSGKLKELSKSVDVEKLGKQTVSIDGKDYRWKAYSVSWKSSSASKTEISDYPLLDTILSIDSPCICYVDSGKLVGIRFSILGNMCLMTMTGENNLWDDVRLSVRTRSGSEAEYFGKSSRSGNSIRYNLESSDNVFFSIEHNSEDGKTQIWLDESYCIFDGIYKSDDRQVFITANLPNGYQNFVSVSMSKPDTMPERLAKKYINVRDMNKLQLLALLSDVGLSALQNIIS